MAWFDKTLQSFTHRNGRLIIQVISESSEVVLHGLPKGTDFLQPVDAGCAQRLKLITSQEFIIGLSMHIIGIQMQILNSI